jgi:peptide/nickel transport system substrate-binding protein
MKMKHQTKRMNKWLTVVWLLLLVVAPVLTAAEARYGGTLNYGIASSTVTVGVDPHVIQGDRTGWVLGQICEGLLNYDRGLNPVPWLARSWTISEDGRSYTFELQRGVRFHNGREMKAGDVKFSLERILDPNTGSRRRKNLSIIDTITVIDDYQLKITLKNPFSPFLTYLVGVYAAIIPQESVNADGKVTQPLGTGPFTFVEWVKNDRLVVKKFPDYWIKGLPYVDQIVFKPLPDDAVRLTALRTAQVDIIHSLPEKLLPKLSKAQDNNFVLSISPGVSWRMLIMNTRKPPLDNIVLRQAIEAAIDREEIMIATTWGFGGVANQIWGEDSFWRMPGDVRPNADPALAQALLKQAGYPQGIDLNLEVKPAFLPYAEVVQDQLKRVGIRCKLSPVDWAALKPRMKSYDYHLAVSGAGWYSDPDARYGRFYSKDGPANYFAGGYTNPKIEALLKQGRLEVDAQKRKTLYTQVFEIANSEHPIVMLCMLPMTHAWLPKVKNFKYSKQGDLAFKEGGLANLWLAE